MESKRFRCEKCKKVFKRKYHLDRHSPLCKGKKASHQCDLCGKVFPKMFLLRRHRPTHNPKPNLTCGICGRSYVRRDKFATHVKTCAPTNVTVGESEHSEILPGSLVTCAMDNRSKPAMVISFSDYETESETDESDESDTGSEIY